jgi:hypothetical protein
MHITVHSLFISIHRLFSGLIMFLCLHQNEYDQSRQKLLQKANNSSYDIAKEYMGWSVDDPGEQTKAGWVKHCMIQPEEAVVWDNLIKKQMSIQYH